tara:strand:- start:1162 stop:1596 length:435 start_codon:yes stop_codon:yes gene_type:complete
LQLSVIVLLGLSLLASGPLAAQTLEPMRGKARYLEDRALFHVVVGNQFHGTRNIKIEGFSHLHPDIPAQIEVLPTDRFKIAHNRERRLIVSVKDYEGDKVHVCASIQHENQNDHSAFVTRVCNTVEIYPRSVRRAKLAKWGPEH